MRTVTISTSFSYMVGAPDVDIQISREIAARDVTEKFKAAATAAIIHYYGRHPEDFKADDTPFCSQYGSRKQGVANQRQADGVFHLRCNTLPGRQQRYRGSEPGGCRAACSAHNLHLPGLHDLRSRIARIAKTEFGDSGILSPHQQTKELHNEPSKD